MKKILSCVIVAMIMCSLLTSCGKDKKEEQNQAEETVAKISSVAEWIEKESDNIDSLKESMDGTDIKLDVVDKKNSLVYQYTFTKISEEDADGGLKEQLDIDIEEQKDAMETVLEMLKKEVPDAESVIFEYYDNDENLITSCEIK